MILKSWEAILGISNAMIKGVILILPLFSLKSGWLQTVLLIIFSGYFSFYSCYIYIKHLGVHSDLDKSIYFHFWNSKLITIFYNITVFLNLLLMFGAYFILIVNQWEGLLPQSLWIPIGNLIFLFLLTLFLKHARFGAQVLSYGLISIAIYCIFLIWVIVTAPAGNNKMPALGGSFAPTAAAITQGFSIQQFFIPILKELHITETKNFSRYTLIIFLLGGFIYVFICIVGSYGNLEVYSGILNREQYSKVPSVESFFKPGQWQVKVIQVICLIHLYSGFIWLLLNAKKRLFCVFHMLWRVKNSKPNQFFTITQIVYVLVSLGISAMFYFFKAPLNIIVQINGGVIGFFFIYLIPAFLQLKCLYISRPKPIFQIVFDSQTAKQPKQYVSNSKSKSQSLNHKQDGLFPKENSQIGQNKQVSRQKQKQKSKISDKKISRDVSLQLSQVSPEKKKRPPPQFIDLLSQSKQSYRDLLAVYNLQDQIAGADVSADLSGRESTISIIGSRCMATAPVDMKVKIFDICSTIGMLIFGLFTMAVSIISLQSQI